MAWSLDGGTAADSQFRISWGEPVLAGYHTEMSDILPSHLPEKEQRAWLVQAMATIDIERKALKAQIADLSRAVKHDPSKDAELRELGEELLYKFQQREDFRLLLASLNARLKQQNRRLNSPKRRDLNLAVAFMNIAEEQLPPELFDELETAAVTLLRAKTP